MNKIVIVSGYFNCLHRGHLELFYKAKEVGNELWVIVNIGENYGESHQLYFANGGDQDNSSIPETGVCNDLGIRLIDGLGDKIQSSSWLLAK